jgi:hypothetical protein
MNANTRMSETRELTDDELNTASGGIIFVGGRPSIRSRFRPCMANCCQRSKFRCDRTFDPPCGANPSPPADYLSSGHKLLAVSQAAWAQADACLHRCIWPTSQKYSFRTGG